MPLVLGSAAQASPLARTSSSSGSPKRRKADGEPEEFQGEFGSPPAWPLEDQVYEDFREWLGDFDILEDPNLLGTYPHFPVGVANELGALRMLPLQVDAAGEPIQDKAAVNADTGTEKKAAGDGKEEPPT